MATLNIRKSNSWNANPSVKVFRDGSWQDAQGFVYKNGSWEVFTEQFFEQINNAVIADLTTLLDTIVEFDPESGFYYALTRNEDGMQKDFTIRKINRYNGNVSFTRTVPLDGSDFGVTSHGADGSYIYVGSYYNIYKLNINNGSVVQRVAKNTPGSQVGDFTFSKTQPYIYFSGVAYNKSNLIKWKDLRNYDEYRSKVYPIENTDRVVITNDNTVRIKNSYGTTVGNIWQKNIPDLHAITVHGSNIYTSHSTQRSGMTITHLTKYDSNGNLLSEIDVKTSYMTNPGSIKSVLTTDNSGNVYIMVDKSINKYDSSGVRKYMYELENLHHEQMRDLFYVNGQIVLWNMHNNKHYSEIYDNP